jgi:hypothetical protein
MMNRYRGFCKGRVDCGNRFEGVCLYYSTSKQVRVSFALICMREMVFSRVSVAAYGVKEGF